MEILCGSRKGNNTEHVLFKLVASWQKFLDKERRDFCWFILMHLSKACDWLLRYPLLAKLSAYSFTKNVYSVFSPNAGKYGPEKLRIRTLFTQC